MKLLKNKEIRNVLIIYILLTVAFSIFASCLEKRAGLVTAAFGLISCVIFLISSKKRYDAIDDLCLAIDRVLHGQDDIFPSESVEGELAMLKSEICKMTLRLREQAETLCNEKNKLSEAITDISHQLRTPLTSMNLTLTMLTSGGISDEKRAQQLRELKNALRRIDWLIEALLKISKLDAGGVKFRKDEVRISDLIEKAASPLLAMIELRGQELSISVGNESFVGDLSWSAEALGNMIKNCSEHTPSGGVISVEASENALFTAITMRDSGIGFDESEIPHLFERFFKGKNSSPESVGVGLALARMIIISQNGTVKAFNHPSGGACFEIKFYKSIV